jgi:TRAP-type C4-dicarboxylate transport system substrate-binding protein
MLARSAWVIAAALGVGACATHDKAGGTPAAGPRTIAVAMQDGDPLNLIAYGDSVARDTGVPTRLRAHPKWRADDPEADADTIADVRAGRVHFALVSARGIDTLGIDAFQPMLAPLAIDSLATEQRVLASDLPARALQALGKLGVVGVAVLPGPLRHPLGLRRRLVRPGDFAGATIGIRSSELTRRTFEQLGASVKRDRDTTYAGVDGIDLDLTSIAEDSNDAGARSLAVDLGLWPKIRVLIANPGAWRALDQRRRALLRTAARASLPQAISTLRERDTDDYRVLCRAGAVPIVRTTARDADAFRRALAPVTRSLDQAALAEIARLRAAAGPPPALPPCTPAARVQPGAASRVDGVWTLDSDAADLRAVGTPPGDITPDNWGHQVMVLSKGRFAITSEAGEACGWVYGTFATHGNRMVWDVTAGYGRDPQNSTKSDRPGERFQYGWSRYKDVLRLSRVRRAASPPNYLAKPWLRIGGDPRRAPFSRRCPLPAAAQF